MQITTFLKPLSSLYFIELPPYFRIFFALAILVQPNVGIAGLIGLLFAAFYLKFLHISYEAKISSCSLLNAMLVSLLIGSLFALNLKTLFLIAIFVFLTLVVTAATEFIFAQFYLSALSLPFCIVALMIFILLPDFYQFLPIAPLWTIDLTQFMPNFIVMFFHALSSILCITNPSIGILIWIIILLFSPLTALFLVIGWAIGIGAESFIHNVNQNLFLYGTDFNYALVFTAIAGFFLTPSRSSLLLASFFTIITSLVAVVSNKILNPYNLPALSIPFCLVTSAAILTLRYFCPSLLNTKFFVSPEKNIETSYSSWNRHRFPEIGVFLPFSGKWQVQQAFNGDITHRGSLKYALDFVALNEEGKIFANSGLELTDHFSFSKEILSPVEGFVTSCVISHEDNIIGRVTNNQNWGNYIIIKTIYGLYVVLAHLKKDSATVSVGSYVKVGQKLAEVGNSGYSQEPHIHMQVQYASEIGSVTAPFHLINYISNNKLHFHNTPLINEIVESTNVNQAINQALNFKIGEEMLFKMNNEITVKIICQLDEIDGRFYLSDGISKVYYGKIGNQFYFYDWQGKTGSPLYDLIISAPKIPLTYGAKLEYEDDLSFIASKNSLQYFSHFLKEIFGFKAKKNLFGKYITDKQGFTIEGVCNLKSQEIKTFIKLDPMLAISEFMVGERRYNRVS